MLSSAQRGAGTLLIKALHFTLASNVALIIAKSVSGHLESHCGAIIVLLLSSVHILSQGCREEFSVSLKFPTPSW